MQDALWRSFFEACAAVLGPGCCKSELSSSCCSWTTFDRLEDDAGYWTCAVPLASELRDTYVVDGGTWGQPFSYSALAHVIVLGRCYWECVARESFESGYKTQPILELSEVLLRAGVPHRLTERLLEIKLY